MNNTVRNMLDKLSKAAWYFADSRIPARGCVSYLNICIHSEVIYDDRTYEALIVFSKEFMALTGNRIVICVSTPVCPLVRKGLVERGVSQDEFGRRVSSLAGNAEIGYHGHFYPQGTTTFDHMRRETYDKELVVRQIRDEVKWFEGLGIKPKVYVGGCWFMMEEIVLELERAGITVDVSIRKGKSDTFGGVFLDHGATPDYGVPFILPPTKNILEIQSIFGPVMPPSIMKYHLSGYMRNDNKRSLAFIFPLHDWDLPKYCRNIWANVAELAKHKESIAWMDVLEMREMYMPTAKEGNIGTL